MEIWLAPSLSSAVISKLPKVACPAVAIVLAPLPPGAKQASEIVFPETLATAGDERKPPLQERLATEK